MCLSFVDSSSTNYLKMCHSVISFLLLCVTLVIACIPKPHRVLLVSQAPAARCEHWTAALERSPSLIPPPSSTSFPSPHRPGVTPSAHPLCPVPLVQRCRSPHYPGGECLPAQRTIPAANQSLSTPRYPTPL